MDTKRKSLLGFRVLNSWGAFPHTVQGEGSSECMAVFSLVYQERVDLEVEVVLMVYEFLYCLSRKMHFSVVFFLF